MTDRQSVFIKKRNHSNESSNALQLVSVYSYAPDASEDTFGLAGKDKHGQPVVIRSERN